MGWEGTSDPPVLLMYPQFPPTHPRGPLERAGRALALHPGGPHKPGCGLMLTG